MGLPCVLQVVLIGHLAGDSMAFLNGDLQCQYSYLI